MKLTFKVNLLMITLFSIMMMDFTSVASAANKAVSKSKAHATQSASSQQSTKTKRAKKSLSKATVKEKKHSTVISSATNKKVEQKLSFNDRMVQGKHQVPGEGIVTVENEKPVFNLLTIRNDFRDRREKEKLRD